MEFDQHTPIYLQIANTLCERILSDKLKEEERIPSVRELGSVLGVNPNTIMRTYDYLQGLDIIYNKRGIGYFISQNAKANVKNALKLKFVDEELREVYRKMNLLEVSIDELTSIIRKFQNESK